MKIEQSGTAIVNPARSLPSDRTELSGPATDFESVLLSKVVSDMQNTFSLDEEDDGIAQQFSSIGAEHLGQIWASAGGIGLARHFSQIFHKHL